MSNKVCKPKLLIFLASLPFLLMANNSKAEQYAFIGVPERFSFQLMQQNASQKCGVSITTPTGEVIEQETFAPNFTVNVTHTPISANKAVFKWNGKILFKGILPTPPCSGSGEFSVDTVSSTPKLNNDDLEQFEQARSKWNSRLPKEALDIALPIAIRGSKPAQAMLAVIFFSGGAGVNRDMIKAYNFAQISSTETSSKLILGRINLHGMGRPQNCQDAITYLNQAIEAEAPAAYGDLGEAYMNGRCVGRNYSEARRLFQIGVEKRHGFSAAQLGNIYENGFGVALDLDEAKSWYQKSREYGFTRAEDMMRRVEAKIISAQEAKKKAEEEAKILVKRKEVADENDRKLAELERLQGEIRKIQSGVSR